MSLVWPPSKPSLGVAPGTGLLTLSAHGRNRYHGRWRCRGLPVSGDALILEEARVRELTLGLGNLHYLHQVTNLSDHTTN